MIRRIPRAALGATALAVLVLATGCSSFATNKNAAEAAGQELSLKDFEVIVSDLQKPNIVNGEVDGTDARSMLTQWVQSAVVTDQLAVKGYVIDDAQRAEAETAMQSQFGKNWTALAPQTQDFLLDNQAPFDAVQDSEEFVPEAELKALYEAGATQSGVFCLRVIAVTDQATATTVQDQLASGADFATLADQHKADPSAAAGGEYLDPTTKSQCIPTRSLVDTVTPTIANTPIGTPTDPVMVGNAYYFFLQRPYDEVAASVRDTAGSQLSGPRLAALAVGQPAHIDSRYGTWDSTTGKVVPAN